MKKYAKLLGTVVVIAVVACAYLFTWWNLAERTYDDAAFAKAKFEAEVTARVLEKLPEAVEAEAQRAVDAAAADGEKTAEELEQVRQDAAAAAVPALAADLGAEAGAEIGETYGMQNGGDQGRKVGSKVTLDTTAKAICTKDGSMLHHFFSHPDESKLVCRKSYLAKTERNIWLSVALLTCAAALGGALKIGIRLMGSIRKSSSLDPEQERLTGLDRMRFTKNSASGNLMILAIVFNVFYFVTLYRINNAWYYKALIGGSIIYNLIFMLVAFLSEENIKNRKSNMDIAVMVLGALQFVRVLVYPSMATMAEVMGDEALMAMLAYLSISGVCCIWAGVTSMIANRRLSGYLELMKNQEIKGRA